MHGNAKPPLSKQQQQRLHLRSNLLWQQHGCRCVKSFQNNKNHLIPQHKCVFASLVQQDRLYTHVRCTNTHTRRSTHVQTHEDTHTQTQTHTCIHSCIIWSTSPPTNVGRATLRHSHGHTQNTHTHSSLSGYQSNINVCVPGGGRVESCNTTWPQCTGVERALIFHTATSKAFLYLLCVQLCVCVCVREEDSMLCGWVLVCVWVWVCGWEREIERSCSQRLNCIQYAETSCLPFIGIPDLAGLLTAYQTSHLRNPCKSLLPLSILPHRKT